MTEYLIELGHKNILFVSAKDDKDNSIEKYKIDGFSNAIKAQNGCKDYLYSTTGFSIKDGYNMGDSIINIVKENDITAVFCSHDELAIGFMSYCYDSDIKVPNDISICGYGDTKIASIYRPRLTTIKEPYYDIGAVATRRIIKKIDGDESEEENTYLPIQLIKRESCREIK